MKIKIPRFKRQSRYGTLEEIYGDSSLVAFMKLLPEQQLRLVRELEAIIANTKIKIP